MLLSSTQFIPSVSRFMFYSLLIHSTGVLCPLFKFFSSYASFASLFMTLQCCPRFLSGIPVPSLSTGVVSNSSFFSVVSFVINDCNPQGSLVSLICQRSNFVSPLPLPLLIPRSRGEISCKWGRVVTARDRTLQMPSMLF